MKMPEYPGAKDLIQLLRDLQHSQEAQQQVVAETSLEPKLALLRTWQTERLTSTYADLLANPQYSPACRFFLSDIYAPRDFSQRDHDAKQLYNLLSRFLPASTLRLLADVVYATQLTNTLDQALLHALIEDLGVTDTITPENYAEGYRICDNYAERKHQIDLLLSILREVGNGARNPLVGFSLRLAKGPAQRAGWFEVHDFLARGYAAAHQVRDFETFAATIQERESTILERIFANHPDPFNL